jgi:prepilin-type N-terminal cleavage/methylation domain-containing protein
MAVGRFQLPVALARPRGRMLPPKSMGGNAVSGLAVGDFRGHAGVTAIPRKAEEAGMCSIFLSRRGLTLVEFLVVVAIIATLGTLLLPALRKAAGLDETQIAIDAFIVTQSRENIRLGLLEIGCAKLNDVVAKAKYSVRRLKEEEDSLRLRLLEKTKELAKLDAELGQLKHLEDEYRARHNQLLELSREVQRFELERTSTERKLEIAKRKFDAIELFTPHRSNSGLGEAAKEVERLQESRARGADIDIGGRPLTLRQLEIAKRKSDAIELQRSKSGLEEAAKEVERLQESLAKPEEGLAGARQALSECAVSLRDLEGRRDDLQRRRDLLKSLKEELQEMNASREAAQALFVRAALASFPAPAFVVKTDADGKAMARVIRDTPCIIWASTDRVLPDGKVEKYDWAVQVPAFGNADRKLFLSSDNLATQDSILALLDTKD